MCFFEQVFSTLLSTVRIQKRMRHIRPVEFKRELQVMLHTGWKSEIQCLSIDDLCDQFLADKTGLVTE
jgi:hypothetical protein